MSHRPEDRIQLTPEQRQAMASAYTAEQPLERIEFMWQVEVKTIRETLDWFKLRESTKNWGPLNAALEALTNLESRLTTKEYEVCKWKQDDDGNWDTECCNKHVFYEGGLKENNHHFCPYCGYLACEKQD